MTPSPEAPAQDVGRLILLLGVACFAGALAMRVTDPFVATLSVEFATPAERVALLATAFTLPFALVQPLVGPLGDALGNRRVIQVGLIFLAVFTLASPFAPDLGTLIALRALSGAAAGGVMPLTLAALGDAVPLAQRQVALSRLLVFGIGGQIGGGAVAGLLAPYLGWRGVLALCGGVALAAAITMWRAPAAGPPVARGGFDPVRAVRRYRLILAMPAARLLYAIVLVEGMLIFGAFPYFAPMLEASGLGSTREAGLTLAAFGCGGIVFALVARPLLGRFGQSRVVALGGVLATLALLGFAVAPAALPFIGAGLVLGTGFYMIHSAIQTRATELAPEARGSAVSLHAFHFQFGQALGPILMGLMGGALGMGTALALAAAGVLALSLRLAKRS
jgi:predicted MFS family arabinose efflux permease